MDPDFRGGRAGRGEIGAGRAVADPGTTLPRPGRVDIGGGTTLPRPGRVDIDRGTTLPDPGRVLLGGGTSLPDPAPSLPRRARGFPVPSSGWPRPRPGTALSSMRRCSPPRSCRATGRRKRRRVRRGGGGDRGRLGAQEECAGEAIGGESRPRYLPPRGAVGVGPSGARPDGRRAGPPASRRRSRRP